MSALDRWWREIKQGKRKKDAPLDTLWKAACADMNERDHYRLGFPSIAKKFATDAERLLEEYDSDR